MPPTLRKRPAPAEPPASAPPAKKNSGVAKAVAKVKETVKKAVEPKPTKTTKATKAEPAASKTNGSKAVAPAKEQPVEEPVAAPAPVEAPVVPKGPTKVVIGATIDLEGFGGEIETNNGEKTTLKKLVDESKNGVVIFTYPKASTPGCKLLFVYSFTLNKQLPFFHIDTDPKITGTTQVCAFRDSYTSLSATGYDIYGLSKDAPKANTTFKTKQKLQYTLLCDTKSSLIEAIGLKKGSGTTRGVFVIEKSGKVLAAQAGSPKGTLETVEKLIGAPEEEEVAPEPVEPETETKKAEIATEEAKEDAKPEEKKTEEKTTSEPATPETNGVNGTNGTSASKEDIAKADVAADVADTAEKLDSKDSEAKAAEAST